jgi:VanZ family protein
MRPLRFTRFWQTVGFLGVCLVVYQSLIPAPEPIVQFPGVDKFLHFSTYAGIMLWFGFIYPPNDENYLGIGAGLIALGITLEFIQRVIGYRSFDYFDMLSNALGVMLGWLLARTRFSKALVYLERALHAYSKG